MNRLVKATKAFIQEAATRLALEPKELLLLQRQLMSKPDPERSFCACCLHLEQDLSKKNQLRAGLKANVDLMIEKQESYDPRFAMLFWMILEFYHNDPVTFFERVPEWPRNIPRKLNVMPSGLLFGKPEYSPTLKCSECSAPVYHTPSGWMCDNGHGGCVIERDAQDLSLQEVIDATDVVAAEVSDTSSARSRFLQSLKRNIDEVKAESARAVLLDEPPKGGIYLEDIKDEKRHIAMFGKKAEKRIIEYNKEPDLPWNKDQQKAFKAIFKWAKTKIDRAPIFRLFGYAGTGKTSMAKKVAVFVENETKGYVLFAAYTGKAAAVLKSKGCANSSTIHSLIYRPKIDRDTGRIIGQEINWESPLRNASLLILDEASMVSVDMAEDLLAFGVPILVLGDPGQLPPPKGVGYFTHDEPDYMLTEIERQAKDNPIIWLATRARLGQVIKPGWYGESRILSSKFNITDRMIKRADQMICGSNATRRSMNDRYRRLNGKYDRDTQYPVRGDRLICLKNNKDNGLLNGTMWTCTEPEIKPMRKPIDYRNPSLGMMQMDLEGLHFKVRSHDLFNSEGDPLIVSTVCSVHMFDHNIPEPPWTDVAHCDQFDFGYCMTGHKAQGSQFDDLLVIDESQLFREDRHKHRYTTYTRAAHRLTAKLTEA